jgi:hypothetical protein
VVDDRPDTTFTEVATGPAAEADEQATLAAPPKLKPGEWWRIRFLAPLSGEQVEFVRVVAAVQDGAYVMGMPHEGWFKEAVAFHSPPFGDVNADLSYNTHNSKFEPVKFPLTDGATWETEFAAMPLTATAKVLDESTAEVEFWMQPGEPTPLGVLMGLVMGNQGDAPMVRLTYDARQHEVVKFESGPIGYEVIEHGYGFEGWVTVPRGEETPIDHGMAPGQSPMAMKVPVEGGFNRLTMMHFVGGVGPGAYRVRTVAPDGTEQVTEALPSTGMMVRFYEATNPDGAWTLEGLVAGAGFAYAMGIAYHQYDIHLPDGAKRSDHSHKVIR